MKKNVAHPRGQGLVEYALIIAFVVLVVIVVLVLMGPAISDAYTDVINIL